jgi:hypothetical protein
MQSWQLSHATLSRNCKQPAGRSGTPRICRDLPQRTVDELIEGGQAPQRTLQDALRGTASILSGTLIAKGHLSPSPRGPYAHGHATHCRAVAKFFANFPPRSSPQTQRRWALCSLLLIHLCIEETGVGVSSPAPPPGVSITISPAVVSPPLLIFSLYLSLAQREARPPPIISSPETVDRELYVEEIGKLF